MRYVLLIVLMVAGATVALRGWAAEPSTSPTTRSSIPVAEVEEFASLIGRPGYVLVDVRTAEEHAAGHIAGTSEIVDWESASFAKRAAELPRAKTYLIYCRSGRRSRLATAQMQFMGFDHLVELKGGMLAWVKAGKAVEK